MAYLVKTKLIVDDVLTFLAIAGVISTGLISPQTADLLSKPLARHVRKRDRQREIRKILPYMKHQKLIEVCQLANNKTEIKITSKGRQRVAQLNIDKLTIKKPLKWDGLWRFVIFDIPESRRPGRDALRAKLRELGFQPIQRSVWAYPFPCLEEIAVLRDVFEVRRYVTLLEAKDVETHNLLLKKFSHLF